MFVRKPEQLEEFRTPRPRLAQKGKALHAKALNGKKDLISSRVARCIARSFQTHVPQPKKQTNIQIKTSALLLAHVLGCVYYSWKVNWITI